MEFLMTQKVIKLYCTKDLNTESIEKADKTKHYKININKQNMLKYKRSEHLKAKMKQNVKSVSATPMYYSK